MKSFFLLVFLVLFFGTLTQIEACSCDLGLFQPLKTRVKQAKQKADAVFVGKLVRLTEPKKPDGTFTGEVIAEFQVQRAWKGVQNQTVTVYTTNICCICGFPFSEGATYIVFAHGKEKLSTGLCTRTSPIAEKDKSDDEKYLGKPVMLTEKKESFGSTSKKP